MTPDERLEGARIKADRASVHIASALQDINAFMATRPYEIATRRDAATRRLEYFLTRVASPPKQISAPVGDALFNLRSALDHLAQQFYLLGTGGAYGLSEAVSFPIFDDAAKYTASSPGRVKGMRQDAMDFLGGLKPYKGGNDTLWRLHRLNIVDKHRLLLTVGGSYDSVNIGATLARTMSGFFKDRMLEPPKIDLYLRPADKSCPLKVGDVLFIDAPDAEPIPHMEFRLHVSFYEPDVLEPQSVIEVLREMGKEVSRILDHATPLLK